MIINHFVNTINPKKTQHQSTISCPDPVKIFCNIRKSELIIKCRLLSSIFLWKTILRILIHLSIIAQITLDCKHKIFFRQWSAGANDGDFQPRVFLSSCYLRRSSPWLLSVECGTNKKGQLKIWMSFWTTYASNKSHIDHAHELSVDRIWLLLRYLFTVVLKCDLSLCNLWMCIGNCFDLFLCGSIDPSFVGYSIITDTQRDSFL